MTWVGRGLCLIPLSFCPSCRALYRSDLEAEPSHAHQSLQFGPQLALSVPARWDKVRIRQARQEVSG